MIDCSERLSAFVVLTRGGCCVSNFDLSNSLPQRGRGTAVGFPEASVAELWGFALVVDEESICRFMIWFLNQLHP